MIRRGFSVLAVSTVLIAGGAATAGATTVSVAPCTGAAVSVTTTSVPGQANTHFGLLLHVTNTGAAPCQVFGYPRVQLLDASGRVVVEAAKTPAGYNGGSAPVRTVLAHGDQATALLEGVVAPDPSQPSYQSSSALRLRLPQDSTWIRVSVGVSRDPGLQVHGFRPGATGGTA